MSRSLQAVEGAAGQRSSVLATSTEPHIAAPVDTRMSTPMPEELIFSGSDCRSRAETRLVKASLGLEALYHLSKQSAAQVIQRWTRQRRVYAQPRTSKPKSPHGQLTPMPPPTQRRPQRAGGRTPLRNNTGHSGTQKAPCPPRPPRPQSAAYPSAVQAHPVAPARPATARPAGRPTPAGVPLVRRPMTSRGALPPPDASASFRLDIADEESDAGLDTPRAASLARGYQALGAQVHCMDSDPEDAGKYTPRRVVAPLTPSRHDSRPLSPKNVRPAARPLSAAGLRSSAAIFEPALAPPQRPMSTGSSRNFRRAGADSRSHANRASHAPPNISPTPRKATGGFLPMLSPSATHKSANRIIESMRLESVSTPRGAIF